MIKYRPHRGSLDESMKEERLFNSIDEMKDHIISDWKMGETPFSKEDIVVCDDSGKDHRIPWKETRYVCVKRMGNEIYDTPQCIGMCSIE